MATGLYIGDLLGWAWGSSSGLSPTPDPDPIDPGEVLRPEALVDEGADVSDHLVLYNPAIEDHAPDLLLWQHKSKPRIVAFVRALAAGAQLSETNGWAIIIGASTIAGAEGVNLDRWGELVGEDRGGLTEDDYRRFIDLRIRANSMVPTADNVTSLLIDAVAPSVVSSVLLPGARIYTVDSPGAFMPDAIASHAGALIRDVRPGGEWLPVVEQVPALEVTVGSIATPGRTIGSIANPGPYKLGRLIYDGRSR